MKILAFSFAFLIGFSAFAQSEKIGPDNSVYIEHGKSLAVHLHDFSEVTTAKNTIVCSDKTGDVFANSLPGTGDFSIKAKVKINNLGGTAASFQLGENYFGFDGRSNDIYLNGPIFGKEVISIKPHKGILSNSKWFDFQIIRKGSEMNFLIDSVLIHTVDYEGAFKGKMGFHPLRANMQISDFSASGMLIPVSLMPPFYTIPTIDLSMETDRQVTVDKEEKQYLGHPTTVLLNDGKSMYMVYPKGHGSGGIIMKYSSDRGHTWGERLEVPESWSTSKEVPTLYPMIGPDGKERIFMFSGLHPVRIAHSEDEGKNWSELEPIFDFGGIVAMGDVIRLKNGNYMAFFHDDGRFISGDMKRNSRFYVYSTISSDGGLSWSNPAIVTTDRDMKLCEPGVIRSPDGNEIAMLLRENGRKFNAAVIFSRDEGMSWSKPVELPASLTGDRHQCLYAHDGRLVITFRDHTYDSPTQGDFVAWVGQYEDLVKQSEGQYRIRLLDNKSAWDCGYPAFEIFNDGSFFAATYGKWDANDPNYVKGVHFSLDEIDEKANELPESTDIFVSESEGYNTFRIPSLWQSSEGVILAFAEGRESKSDHAANDIVLKRSTDGGKSWSKLQVVAEQGDDCLNNPMIVEDERNGRLLLMYQKYPLGYHERHVGTGYDSDTICRSYIQHSDDSGASWSSAREITQMVKRPTWVTSIAGGPGNGIQLKSGENKGRLLMPFNQGPAGFWKVYAVYSDDGGESWEYGEVAFEKSLGMGNEVQMVELSDGRIMINSRSANGSKLRKTALSSDGGENWTGLIDEPQLIEPQCMGSILSVSDDSNSIPVLLFSIPNTKNGRRYGTIKFSLDDGTSWSSGKCIYNGSYAYSSLADLGSGSFGVLFEKDDYETISFLRTDIKWLTRKK